MYKVLKEININPGISQRKLASEIEYSLGKINSIIECLINEEFINKEIQGRSHKYYISKKGIDVLEKHIKSKKDVKLKLNTTNDVKITSAVILAAGVNKNFNKPVSLIEVDEITLINRLINQLRDNDIQDIVVVVGNEKERLVNHLDNKIKVVENENYKWTGTMASLACASKYIESDFILLETDIIIENMGIKELIKYPKRDCIIITAESGTNDEAFVEIVDEKVYKISKDIRQLNQVDGEMIGVSKISYEFFKKMIKRFQSNKNPYMNYEYMMLDISREYMLGYIKIDNLLWYEIDNQEHLNYVQAKLIPKIKRKEQSIFIDNLSDIVSKSMDINKELITQISPLGGMTNKNYNVIIGEERYVLRVPGNGTDKMISRVDEMKNAAFAAKIGVDAELVYFDEETGVKISKFIHNAETLSPEGAKHQESMKKVCKVLKEVHNSTLNMENYFDIYSKIEQYECLLKEANGELPEDYYEVREKVWRLKEIMQGLDVKYTPCHNDTVAENFINGDNNSFYLIDWEYGGMNDPMWDLAAHSIECGFSDDEEEIFFKIYFNGKVEENYKKRIGINKIYQDFLWSIWTIIKEAKGDDFGSYGSDRYNRAKLNLAKIF